MASNDYRLLIHIRFIEQAVIELIAHSDKERPGTITLVEPFTKLILKATREPAMQGKAWPRLINCHSHEISPERRRQGPI